MERMKILGPVNSYEGAELQIKTGADEIYLGLTSKVLKNLTFSGRGVKLWNDIPCQITSDEVLRRIIKLAHDHDVKVVYAANIPITDPGKEMYLEHVWKGVDAGVDAIIIADVAAAAWIRDEGIDLPLHGSIFFNSFNRENARFLKEMGLSRVVLPHHILLDEMKDITKYDYVKYEVFIFLGCSNVNGRCYLLHGSGESVNLSILCRNIWEVQTPDGKTIENRILDSAKDCGICGLTRLHKLGISVLKIMGRCIRPEITASYTKIYKEALNDLYNGLNHREIKRNVLKKVPWWEEKMCDLGRCKFIPTPTSLYEI